MFTERNKSTNVYYHDEYIDLRKIKVRSPYDSSKNHLLTP